LRSNNTWIGNQVRLKASLYDTSELIYYRGSYLTKHSKGANNRSLENNEDQDNKAGTIGEGNNKGVEQ